MRRRAFFLSVIAFAVIKASSCTTYQSEIAKDPNLPPADPQLLYKYITEENKYGTWDLWPGKGTLYKGQPPHGAFLTTYLNKTALSSMKAKRTMADGAIIVKENYSPGKQLVAVTVMYKVVGYNEVVGDWYWAKYGADGSVQKSGKVPGCINCHGTKKENDYIFTSDFVQKGKEGSGGY